MSGLLEAALRYAALGYRVFPCAPGRKTPLTKHGFHEAKTDPDQIERWWTAHPMANIGIATEGLVVIDVDGPENPWLTPERAVQLAVATLSLTANGGRHYVFVQPAERAYRGTAGRLAPRVDTRANGNYILAPPSVVGGKAYRWAEGLALDVSPKALPEPPVWLVKELDQFTNGGGSATSSPQGQTAASSGEEANPIPTGQRNATLARLAGAMRRVGMSQGEISAALNRANRDRCVPPLSSAEVERIAASVARYEPDQVAVAVVEDHWSQLFDGPSTAAVDQPCDPGLIPEPLLRVPGFISEVMDFTLSHAPYPNVGLAFCGAVALQSYLCGRKVCDPGDLRPNLYLLALASSGTGKDFPRKVNARVLFEIGHIAALGDKFASGEGIQDALVRTGAMLFQNDEMDGVLRQINLDRENKRESIPNILLTLYTSAADVYPIRAKASQKEAVHIDQPHLTLFGTATPQAFYESLSQRMLTNGFCARMIIVDVGSRGEGQPAGSPRQLPKRILETANWWAEFQPGTARKNLLEVHPEPRIVSYAPQAEAAIGQLQRLADAEYDRAHERNDETARVAWSRTCENAKKLALIYACSASHEEPLIDLTAIEWASQFAMHQTRRQLYLAQMYVAENPFHAECLKLLRKLKDAGGELARNRLMRAMRCKLADFDQIVGTLLMQGDIQPVEIATKTKSAQGYRICE